MKKLSVKEQLELLEDIKEDNKYHTSKRDITFFLCNEIEKKLEGEFDCDNPYNIDEYIPLFKRENAEKFTKKRKKIVWFNNNIERHAFLDWMIEQLEAELKHENK